MLHIHHFGDPTAPPVVLLHGFMGRGDAWQPLAEQLSAPHHLLAPDLPGHGRSVGLAASDVYTMPGAARALKNVIEATGSRVDLAGYSMGGRLALYLAVEHPYLVRTLTLLSGSPGLSAPEARAARRAMDAGRAEAIEKDFPAFLSKWYAQPVFDGLPARVREDRITVRAANDPAEVARSLRGMGTGAQPSLWERMPLLDIPTAVLAGGRDAKYVRIAQQMAAAGPSFTAHIVAGAGHVLLDEAPDAVSSHLARQLSERPVIL